MSVESTLGGLGPRVGMAIAQALAMLESTALRTTRIPSLAAVLLAAAALVGLQGCGCGEVGCFSTATIVIDADKWPDGVYTATIEADGMLRTCTATHSAGLESDCGDSFDIGLTIGGEGEPATISTVGESARIRVVLERDGAPLLDETVEPDYDDFRPNGAFCGPTCSSARIDLAL